MQESAAMQKTERIPALFIGHGSPMNAIENTVYSRQWRALAARLPRPRAIVAISAHWYRPGTAVTVNARPRTIHDFGGFPRDLYEVQYPAPGAPDLALRLRTLLEPVETTLDDGWGLDHGTWSILCHMYPEADVPVVQLSIDSDRAPSFHLAIGRSLAQLRDEGVLLLGSGNVVHNLRRYDWSGADGAGQDWALRFEEQVQSLIEAGEHDALVEYTGLGPDAKLSIPTPEHYLPLLYVLGGRRADDRVRFPVKGVQGGSVSMLSVELGG